MEVEKSWFSRLFSSDHRRSARHTPPNLYAYYWEGSASTAHRIQDISSTGFFLLTKQRWLPGTIVTMTLQKDAVAGATPELYIAVQTKVVRMGEDGVGFAFLHPEHSGALLSEVPASAPAGRRAFEKFLDQLLSEQGHVVLGAPVRESWQAGRASEATSGGSVMKTLREENGQALVITVLSMTILLGFAALAGDVGIMYRTKRIAQTAADAAAIAGAQQIIFNNTGNVTNAAVTAAAQNGMTNGVNGATITVNNPPQNGPFAAKTNTAYVEVIASQVEPTIFMKMFNFNSLTVSSRAVAYSGGAGTNCLYVLNQSASNAFDMQGNFNVNAPNCGVIVDSNANPALNCTGGAGTMTAGSVAVVGGANCNPGQVTPTPVTGVAPVSDPLAALPVPTFNPSSCTAYPGGANIGPATAGGTVCYTLSGITNVSNVNLSPGTYVFTGNGIVTFGGTVTGTGVTLFLDTNVNLDATNGTLNLTAPTSGPYSGLLIFAETQNSGGASACNNRATNYNLCFAKGTATGTLTGIIYAPHASMELHDQAGGLSLTTDLIVDTLYDQTGLVNLQSYTQSHGNSPLKKVVLVE